MDHQQTPPTNMTDNPNHTTIGFDAKRIVSNSTGLGNYGRTLVNALADGNPHLSLRLYAPDSGREDLRAQVSKADNVTFCYPENARCRLQKDWWRHRGITRQLVADGVDIFHGLSGELPVGIKNSGIKSVVTIHDLIFMRHPEYYKRIDAYLYKRKFLATCREADQIIAISECTKRDIMAFSNYPERQIKVIYQACGTHFKQPASADHLQSARQTHHLPQRYALYVGSIEERKNLLLAVKAVRHLPTDVSLVAVGRPTPYLKKVRKYIHAHGLEPRVRMLHDVGNDELPAIYQQAECFVYPSRYEGFGIPIIEAIQSGLPVVACTGSCLEEAGGPNSLYVHPDDEEALAQAIAASLQGSPGRDERIAKSQAYVRRFENADVANQVLEAYRSLRQAGTHR